MQEAHRLDLPSGYMCHQDWAHRCDGETGTECPTATITDCDVDEWVPEECSVSCGNDCDLVMLCNCGGWQEMWWDSSSITSTNAWSELSG